MRAAADKPAADDKTKRSNAEKLLGTAYSLAATDASAAVTFARQSLRYPAVLSLPTFLYELAKYNKATADQFYVEALNAYSAAPMDQFLYLSSYPFGNKREAGTISKAPKTIVSARALLALAHLYAKIDMNRGVEELGNAVRTINTLESPDFSRQFVMMKIEGKNFGSYAAYQTPGFNPENAFREMGKLDFDGSLAQATTFTDKSLRALTTLAVLEPCFAAKRRK